MSIFRSVSEISTEDLAALLAENAVENLRLEFKRTIPAKDEFLKKASAFFNTYGGTLVIGAQANSKDGRVEGLPGVDKEPGLKQRLVQWCFEGLWPPTEVSVSDPVPVPNSPERVCYVVAFSESPEAPHFINGRKGCFVRTDEFSQRFESRLATYDEIAHLRNRREELVRRRKSILIRALNRLEVVKSDTSWVPAARLTVFVCPLFPAGTLTEEDQLVEALGRSRVRWRHHGFPIIVDPISQHESLVLVGAAGDHSAVEVGIWGSLFYSSEIEDKVDGGRLIHLSSLVGLLLVFLEHSSRFLSQTGFSGLVQVTVGLHGVRGVPVATLDGPSSPLDDEFQLETRISVGRLASSRDALATQMLKQLLFALNWQLGATDESVGAFVNYGYEFNGWTMHPP